MPKHPDKDKAPIPAIQALKSKLPRPPAPNAAAVRGAENRAAAIKKGEEGRAAAIKRGEDARKKAKKK